MSNHYIISRDLHKIYNSSIGAKTINSSYGAKSVEISNNKSYNSDINIDKSQNELINKSLNELINKYYNINNYHFTKRPESYYEILIEKFNIGADDLVINDQISLIKKYLPKPERYLEYDQGLIVFDLSLVSEDILYKNFSLLISNYEKLSLNSLYDKYVIFFSGKKSTNSANQTNPTNSANQTNPTNSANLTNSHIINFTNLLKDLFKTDLNKLLLEQRIFNIPHFIKNEQMEKKINSDLVYANYIRSSHYDRFYNSLNSFHGAKSPADIISYEKSLVIDLNSDNYKVAYVFNNEIFEIDQSLVQNILNKLHEYNIYLNNIISDLDLSGIKLSIVNSPDVETLVPNPTDIDLIIEVNDLFDIDKLSLLEKTMKTNNLKILMDDVFDNNIGVKQSAETDQTTNTDQTTKTNPNFVLNIIVFLNELIKRKMIKTIKLFNYIENKSMIENNLK